MASKIKPNNAAGTAQGHVPVESSSSGSRALRFQQHAPTVLLLLVMVAVSLVRWRLTGVPLERDEGEYAYAGQLILQGIPPYELAYNMKFPGTYYAYALIMAALGESARAIHLGLLVVHLATAWFVYLLGRRWFGHFPATAGAAAFLVLGIDRWIMGVWAHATHFVLLPALAGLVLLLRAMDSRRNLHFLLAGALLGLCVLMKQHGIFLLLGAGMILLVREFQDRGKQVWVALRPAWVFGAGSLLPFSLLLVVLAAQGVLDAFWYWTFEYAARYVSLISPSDGWGLFRLNFERVSTATWPLWLAGAAGWGLTWLIPRPRATRLEFSVFCLFSLLAIVPGLYFRAHYFILLLPAVALGFACTISVVEQASDKWVGGTLPRTLAAVIALGMFAQYGYAERAYLAGMSATDLSRARYGYNPFIESIEIARYIRDHTGPHDRVAVLGSEPQIYFYAGRQSVTGYIYTYPLMEEHDFALEMQEQMIREVESGQPEYVVIVDVQTSWLGREGSERRILDWMTRYWSRCYRTVGIAEPVSFSRSVYRWDEDARDYSPATQYASYVLKKNSPGPCSAG